MKFFFIARNFLNQKISRFSAALCMTATLAMLAGCGAGNTSGPAAPPGAAPAGTPAAATAATLALSATPVTVKSDNSTSTTITVTTLNTSNALATDILVSLSADTGILSVPSVITGAAGTATAGIATFTFSSGVASKDNRTATITARSAGAPSAQIPVQIVGSTVTLNSNAAALPDDGSSPATLTVAVKDAGGNAISGSAVTLTTTGTGNVTLTPASGTTDVNGQLIATVAGAAAGTATVTATALGATASTAFTVSPTAATFAITQTTNGTVVTANPNLVAMKIGDSLVVEVFNPNPPSVQNPVPSVTFATTLGTWIGGTTVLNNVPVVAGVASATLTTTQAGLANVQVFDPVITTSSDALAVSMTAVTAAAITLQASPSVVATSVGTTTGVSTLLATVTDAAGRPVGDAPIAFSIINPTGGGESVSPVVVFSASTAASGLGLGQARTTFTSGSLPSAQGGVQVRASVLGTGVATNTSPSGNDAAIVIGGTAGSIAFGQATVLQEADNATNYVLAMSVLVADVNGSPAPAGTVVNLSLWPIAWSTGTGCSPGPTFYNEDVNENLFLDLGEDGARSPYPAGAFVVGNLDSLLTPPNSAAGTVPGTVTTDANGVATFNLTYSKTSAIWNVVRLRARTIVQGTEALSEFQFRLAPLLADIDPVCLLPDSPYRF